MWADKLVAALFLYFFVWLFISQFTRALECLGYRIATWLRVTLIVLILAAFGLAYFFPGQTDNPFR